MPPKIIIKKGKDTMKKVIIVMSVVLIIIFASTEVILNIQKNNSNELLDNDVNIANTDNVATIEIRGIKYKDINSIPKLESSFDNKLVYAEPIKEGNDSYVKLSDTFFINENTDVRVGEFDSNKRITQIEMLPSKIYSTESDANYLYTYNDVTYFIPVEKCNSGEERIVYRDYGLELIKKDDSIKIKDQIANDVILGWDLRECDFSRIFDDDNNSLEFIYTSGITDHVHITATLPHYSIVTYNDNQGIKNYSQQMLWFNNILNYKNVFYGYDAFENNQNVDNLLMIKEQLVTGYYIFDKEQGLIHVNRFANGEKHDETGFKKLSEIALTLDRQHIVKKGVNGENRIDAFPMYDIEYLYDENGNIVENEDGTYKVNPNSKKIEDGTKIFVSYISEDGYSFTFKTEDGTEYDLNYYYD